MKKTKLILALCFSASIGFAQTLINVAGNGTFASLGSVGDGGAATSAELAGPWGIVLDAAKNIYIVDNAASNIRRVDAVTGIITTVAGNSSTYTGYSGDGGAASLAQFNRPSNICIDVAGNLYITDTQNNVVRKITAIGGQITPACLISTVAGNGNLCAPINADPCGDGGAATDASLGRPVGIAVDNSGNLYIGESTSYAIRKVDVSGIITTVAGNPNHWPEGGGGSGGVAVGAGITDIEGITIDLYGNLYCVDGHSSAIYKIAAVGGQITSTNGCIITTVAGAHGDGYNGDNIAATSANLNNPKGVAIDAVGNVYISDYENWRIRKVDHSTHIITTIAGDGLTSGSNYVGVTGVNPTSADIQPVQLALDACGNIYFPDGLNATIGKIVNGSVATFTPSIGTITPYCGGNNVTVAGLNSGTTPDSYSWQMQSCNSLGVLSVGRGNYNSGIITNTGNPGGFFTFPNTSAVPCNQYYLITLTVTKNCPTPTTATVTQVIEVYCGATPVITGTTTICAGTSTTLHSNYIYSSNNHIDWNLGTSHSTSQNVVVTPSITTTYTLTDTYVPTGCSAFTVATVTVVPNNPDFTYITNYASPNNYFTVSATPVAANGYSVSGFGDLWVIEQIDPITFATIPNTNTSTGTQPNPICWWSYYPNANVFGGFDGTKSSGINNVNCGPPVSPLNGEFLNGATYRITRGTWNSICSWAQISHTITVSGHRPVNGNSNTNLDESTIDYSYLRYQQATAGVTNLSIDNSSLVTVYPNPSNGNFIVETTISTPQLLEIYDLTGRIVKSQTIQGKATINGADLVDGVYNIKISNSNSVVNKRMIITK